jgi:hypothetical protein
MSRRAYEESNFVGYEGVDEGTGNPVDVGHHLTIAPHITANQSIFNFVQGNQQTTNNSTHIYEEGSKYSLEKHLDPVSLNY